MDWLTFNETKAVPENDCSIKEIEINRDHNYNLTVKFHCEIPTSIVLPTKPDILYKAIFEGIENKIVTRDIQNPHRVITIINFDFNTTTSSGYELNKITYIGEAQKIEITFDYARLSDNYYTTYWLINSSQDMSYSEQYKISKRVKKEVKYGDSIIENSEYYSDRYSSNSIIRLYFNNNEVLFGTVRQEHSKLKKSSFLKIAKGKLTNNEISELVRVLSFICGVEFEYIGYTCESEEFKYLKSFYESTNRTDIEKVMNDPEYPVMNIISYFNGLKMNKVQDVINNFIEEYFKNKEKFNLEYVFWYVNYSRFKHPLIRQQPLSTAFDIISKRYYKGKGNKIISDTIFKKIKKDFIARLDQEQKNIKEEAKIDLVNKINNLNSLSINKRNSTIFEDLKMDLSSLESQSLSSRNRIVHGQDSVEPINNIKEANAFYTLINRIILRILNVEEYIDRSTGRLEVNKIHEPQKGNYLIRYIE